MARRLMLLAAVALLAAACNPAKSAEDAKAAEVAADPAAAKAAARKAEIKAEQAKQEAEYEAVKTDEAKVDDLADAGNGFALYNRGQARLKSPEGYVQQGGFDDLEAAAKAGNALAQIWVGQHMAYGLDGYPLKPNSGLQMLTRAAEQDNIEAILAVGLMYEQDTFMKDLKQAKVWYEKGVALGSDKAKDALAKLGTQEDFQ